MSDDELDTLHGYDFRSGRIRSMKHGTAHYRQQPYLPKLLVVQRVIEDFSLHCVTEVQHTDACAGKSSHGKDAFCDCHPEFVLHFRSGQTYRYRSDEPDAERFLRSWIAQNKQALE